LAALLREQTSGHREYVVANYADNEEAMIRTERWKFIYGTGARRRRDGYALEEPHREPWVRLYDLDNDPDETLNLAGQGEHARRVRQLMEVLANRLVQTAREPELVPKTNDPPMLLAHCLKPVDVDIHGYLRKFAQAGQKKKRSRRG